MSHAYGMHTKYDKLNYDLHIVDLIAQKSIKSLIVVRCQRNFNLNSNAIEYI